MQKLNRVGKNFIYLFHSTKQDKTPLLKETQQTQLMVSWSSRVVLVVEGEKLYDDKILFKLKDYIPMAQALYLTTLPITEMTFE